MAEMQASFTMDNHGKATVVFDGILKDQVQKIMSSSDGAPKLQIRLIYQLQHKNLLGKRIALQITYTNRHSLNLLPTACNRKVAT